MNAMQMSSLDLLRAMWGCTILVVLFAVVSFAALLWLYYR